MLSLIRVDILQVLAVVGILYFSTILYRFVSFIWLYLKPSGHHLYLHGPKPYVLITGASDGIGKAIALELYNKGFNLLLHARNEGKIKKVVEEIHASGTRSGDIRYFLAAADDVNVNFSRIAEQHNDLNITLLINNVGGASDRPERIDTYSEQELFVDVRVNALFPLYLTRAFLPKFRSTPGRVLVIFVGSQSAEIRCPRLSTYASSKAFLKQLNRSLNSDEKYWTPSNVSFMYWGVGAVVSNGLRGTPSFFTPAATTFAKSVIARIGCGEETVIPYFPHAIQNWFAGALGDDWVEKFAAETVRRSFAAKRE